MELSEMIKIMQHYEDGGNVEFSNDNFETVILESNKEDDGRLCWNWSEFNYRIKEQKQKVTIEKWLLKDVNSSEHFIMELSDIDLTLKTLDVCKVKLIESYEVEL